MDEAEDLRQSVAEWEKRLHALANEREQRQIALPKAGDRVNREAIASAFRDAFEVVGGTSRLALWADANYGDFVKIFSRLLPKESVTTHDGTVRVLHVVPQSNLDGEHGDTTLREVPSGTTIEG